MADVCLRLLRQLESEAGWQLPDTELDDLTYTYRKTEIQFLRNESAQVDRVLQLRPVPGLRRGVFIVDVGENDLHRFAIRRIAMHFSTRPRMLAPRPCFHLEDMVFLIASSHELVSIAHFKGSNGLAAAMAVAGPEPLDDCDALMSHLSWTALCKSDWGLEPHLYVRHERGRSRNRCTRTHLEISCPGLVDLFDLACSVESIPQAEEDRWFMHAQVGAAWAIERIVTYSLRMVFDVAYRLCRQNDACPVPFEDVFSGGIEGLMLAIEKYEVERGHRFASFAWQWVANKADRVFVESLWPINVPYYVWTTAGKGCRNFEVAKALYDHRCSDKTLAELLGLDEQLTEVVRLLTGDNAEIVEVDQLDDLPDPTAEDDFDLVLEAMSLPSSLTVLTNRQKDVVLLRNGLHPQAWGQEMTLEQIANRWEVTRERVRQIEMMALKRLRADGDDLRTPRSEEPDSSTETRKPN